MVVSPPPLPLPPLEPGYTGSSHSEADLELWCRKWPPSSQVSVVRRSFTRVLRLVTLTTSSKPHHSTARTLIKDVPAGFQGLLFSISFSVSESCKERDLNAKRTLQLVPIIFLVYGKHSTLDTQCLISPSIYLETHQQ